MPDKRKRSKCKMVLGVNVCTRVRHDAVYATMLFRLASEHPYPLISLWRVGQG